VPSTIAVADALEQPGAPRGEFFRRKDFVAAEHRLGVRQ
jgi:hypothetical protein